jgi:hypothetical protein
MGVKEGSKRFVCSHKRRFLGQDWQQNFGAHVAEELYFFFHSKDGMFSN